MGYITERVVYTERYDMLYVQTGKTTGTVEFLQNIIPHDGYKLYAVKADYRPRGGVWYYVVAQTPREARLIFFRKISWLKIFTVQEIANIELKEKILNNPSRYIII